MLTCSKIAHLLQLPAWHTQRLQQPASDHDVVILCLLRAATALLNATVCLVTLCSQGLADGNKLFLLSLAVMQISCQHIAAKGMRQRNGLEL